jgi:hypothetical protein
MEYAKTNDVVVSGLTARPASSEAARAMGKFTFECFDKDGKLKWTAESKNLVVNTGLQYMAGTALDGATSRITSWYIGLTGAGASNQFNATDTLASHPAAGSGGWTEITPYSGSRPAATFAAATTANPSVVTNSASKASYSITSSATVGGAFLASAASGTSGTLFSGSDFTGGDRSVVNGDTLQVTYTFSLSA